jgi:hypothetical protein
MRQDAAALFLSWQPTLFKNAATELGYLINDALQSYPRVRSTKHFSDQNW